MMLSVIIPTCDRNNLLGKCLDKLMPAAQSVQLGQYEVIVTDDSKENSAKPFIEDNYAWAKWVKGPKKGPAANRNSGSGHASGDWLIFIDDDCLPGDNLIYTYNEAIIKYEGVRVFEGYIGADREQRNFLEESPLNTTGGYLWSCNFMIQKELFQNVLKGFDEKYPYAAIEDVDLHYRLKKLSEPIRFLENAIVIHPWRIQVEPVKTGKKRFSSLLYFLDKFPEKKRDYDSQYFVKAFYAMGIGIIKNAARFRFRGFTKRILIAFMQLYFAFKVSFK